MKICRETRRGQMRVVFGGNLAVTPHGSTKFQNISKYTQFRKSITIPRPPYDLENQGNLGSNLELPFVPLVDDGEGVLVAAAVAALLPGAVRPEVPAVHGDALLVLRNTPRAMASVQPEYNERSMDPRNGGCPTGFVRIQESVRI